jgi:dihydrofolate synthase/folylpolyglutamate synthase
LVYLPHWPIPSTLGKRQIDYETVFERMEIVLEKLDNPHKKLPPVIHISGTNGKGSTAALIAEIFSCSGKKTHLYTSPHLQDCNERIVLGGEKISDNFLFEIMEEARIAAGETPLTFFEAFTIGAFLAFSRVPADLLVVECGMGGRIDATNIIKKKLLTVITPISFDHVEYLGNSIERIALEKAMIIRPETALIVASQPAAAKKIIKILAADQKIPAYFYDEDFFVEMNEEVGELADDFAKSFNFRFQDYFLENLPKPALPGSHQYINFATAIAAACLASSANGLGNKTPEILDELAAKNDEDFFISVSKAITSVTWPSRLERIKNSLEKLLPEGSELWIDGAHNEAGAFALARWITEQKDEKENFVICGFSKNKCKKEFLEKFQNIAELLVVRVSGEPNPESAEKISEIGAKIGMKISVAGDLSEALQRISRVPSRVVICGSMHLARDVKSYTS